MSIGADDGMARSDATGGSQAYRLGLQNSTAPRKLQRCHHKKRRCHATF
jgi:hypothetical protein